MNNRIIRTRDGRVYYCAECPYRNLLTGFCGFCMRKIIDEVKARPAPLGVPAERDAPNGERR